LQSIRFKNAENPVYFWFFDVLLVSELDPFPLLSELLLARKQTSRFGNIRNDDLVVLVFSLFEFDRQRQLGVVDEPVLRVELDLGEAMDRRDVSAHVHQRTPHLAVAPL